jgi:hypothetical protein
MQLAFTDVRTNIAVGTFGRVCLQSWLNAVELEDVRFAFRHIAAQPRDIKWATLAIGGVGVKMPDDETRKASAELMARLDPGLVASAVVVEGEGFFASVARGVIAGIFSLSRSRVPQRAFRTAPEAVAWLAPRLEMDEAHASALTEALMDLRRMHLIAQPV